MSIDNYKTVKELGLYIFEQEAQQQLYTHESQNYSLYEPRFNQMMKWTQLIKPKIVLDLFSSWGYFIKCLNEQFPSIIAHGLDGSLTKVEYCSNKEQTVIQGDIRTMEPTQVYDLVYFSDNLIYFPDPIYIGQKVAKWGKYVIFTTPLYSNEDDVQVLAIDGLLQSYPQPETLFEIASLIGKMVEYTTIMSPTFGVRWACSLIEVL